MQIRTRRSFASYAVLVVVLVLATGPAIAARSRITGLTVDRPTVRSGQSITATATADRACAWTIAWNGEVRRSTGTFARATFTAPTVGTRTRLPLRAICAAVPVPSPPASGRPSPGSTGSTGATQQLSVKVPAAQVRALVITVLPKKAVVQPPGNGEDGSAGGGGDLPDTGGPDRNVLLAALGAVLAGLLLILAGSRGRRVAAAP